MRAWAQEACPLVDIDTETRLFILRFTPEDGEQPEERPGWTRSWKAWMVRQQGWTKERQSNVRQLRPTGTDGRHGNGSGPRLNPNATYSENLADY